MIAAMEKSVAARGRRVADPPPSIAAGKCMVTGGERGMGLSGNIDNLTVKVIVVVIVIIVIARMSYVVVAVVH